MEFEFSNKKKVSVSTSGRFCYFAYGQDGVSCIGIPKLPEELREDSSDIELWGKFIRAERKEEFDVLAEKNAYIGSAYKHLQVISQDEEKRLEYEAREKAIRDCNQIMLEAALKQIEEKKYETALTAKGVPKEKIRKYGFAFSGKKY